MDPGALPWIRHCISTFLTIYPGKVDSFSRRWCSKEHSVKAQRNVESIQRARRVVSDSPGLVGFAIGLVNSVINLPNGQVKFFEESKLQRNSEINLLIEAFLGLVEMMFGLVC